MSVVIPVYNRVNLLERAVRSVLDQAVQNLEIIIVDDGSTDHPERVPGKFNDERIRIIRLDHTGHIGMVRHAGAMAANGRWIAFLDSDDSWHPAKMQRQLDLLKNTGRRWCYSGFRHVNDKGEELLPRAGKFKPFEGWITRELLKHEATVVICTLILERTLYFETGGFSTDARLLLRGDYEFMLRLSQHAEASVINEVLVDVLEHEERVTKSVTDPHARSMVPYQLFLEQTTDPALRKIAYQQISRLIRESALVSSDQKKRRVIDIIKAIHGNLKKVLAT